MGIGYVKLQETGRAREVILGILDVEVFHLDIKHDPDMWNDIGTGYLILA